MIAPVAKVICFVIGHNVSGDMTGSRVTTDDRVVATWRYRCHRCYTKDGFPDKRPIWFRIRVWLSIHLRRRPR